MKRLDKDDPRRWHRTVGKGGSMKRAVPESDAAKAAPLPGTAPQPMPLEVGPGSFWPTPLGYLCGIRLFVDHDAERLELTIVQRTTMNADTDLEALHTVPLCFAAMQAGPVLWICMRTKYLVHTIALAIGADTTEAAALRRLVLDPTIRKSVKVVFAARDMVKVVRSIEDVSFPWQALRQAARLFAQEPKPADLCTSGYLQLLESSTGPSLYESDAAVHAPPDFGRSPPKTRTRRSPKAGATQRQP